MGIVSSRRMFPLSSASVRLAPAAPLAAAFLREFCEIYAARPGRGFVKEYRLLVRYGDGPKNALFSGEVSVRPD